MFSCARMAAPSSFSHWLPSVWSKCQWVLIRCLIGSRLRLLTASRMRGRVTVMPASMNSLPSPPVRTAILPPEPSRMLTLPRRLWTVTGVFAAESRIRSTMLRASANACEGLSHPPLEAKPAATAQHMQKPRRERVCRPTRAPPAPWDAPSMGTTFCSEPTGPPSWMPALEIGRIEAVAPIERRMLRPAGGEHASLSVKRLSA